MFEIKNHFVKQLCFLILSFQLIFTPGLQGSTHLNNNASNNSETDNNKRVGSITIKGDGLVNIGVVRNYLSFHEGSSFSEEAITRSVKKIESTGYFKNTQIFKSVNEFDPSKLDIYVKLEEKALLKGYEFEGNRQISSKKLAEITGLKDMESVSIHDIKHFKNCIINEYYKMNYLNFKVDVIIKVSKGKQNKVNLVFKCEEGSRLRLKEVDFDGCHNVLKSAMAEKLYTKEDWLLSPINGAGKFNWELLELDKSNIQRYYMDRGYYKAGVVDTIIDKNEKTNDVSVKFVIEEGSVHKVRFVDVPSDEIYKQEFLERQMLLGKGDVFSTSKLVSSMDRIKNLFGVNGYVFCNVYPDVTPVVVDGEMFVDIKINVDKGLVYKINEIRIFGNFKTREYVIRRELLVKEGGLANKVAMDSSLIRIEALGYFDRNLDWKITKISEDQVDLELQVKEVKTGSGNIGLTMSPDKGSNNATVKFAAEIKKRNFNGLGWDLGGSLACGKDSLQKVDFDFRNPAIFNSNVFFNSKLFMNKVSYSELNVMQSSPIEKTAGFSTQLGFYLFPSSLKITAAVDVGCNHVSFSDINFKSNLNSDFLETMMRDRFKQGLYSWVGINLGQNKLNHPLYPSQGWAWNSGLKMALPGLFNNQYSMVKSELSAKYFTSIIGRERLVFSATAILGRVFELGNNQPIPFQELYLVGGADSLRGYRWGEAGPSNKRYNSPLGAKKELLARFELISPATIHDISIDTPRAYVFYDVGAAWDTPITYAAEKVDGKPVYNYNNQLVMKRLIPEKDIIKNKFDLRHSVGIGFRMTVPQPIKIEWGYKLNKKSSIKEKPSEWHLTMNMPFDF